MNVPQAKTVLFLKRSVGYFLQMLVGYVYFVKMFIKFTCRLLKSLL